MIMMVMVMRTYSREILHIFRALTINTRYLLAPVNNKTYTLEK